MNYGCRLIFSVHWHFSSAGRAPCGALVVTMPDYDKPIGLDEDLCSLSHPASPPNHVFQALVLLYNQRRFCFPGLSPTGISRAGM
jgi:hypothetical protein